MAAQYNPKTLAKTISYISYHAPSEYGLFWDPEGTMPWKEFYWALQEDPSLRFVRESHIRELTYLELEIPFVLDGNVLRLAPRLPCPSYPLAERPPERLYFACRRKQYPILLEHGITPSHRSYMPICEDRELALCIGRRRDPEPLLVEVMAAKASTEGVPIRSAGPGLYLVERMPLMYLILPLIRADQHAALTASKRAETKPSREYHPVSPGSFYVEAHQLHGQPGAMNGAVKAGKTKGKKKTDWKRDAKKERHKRSI